MNEGFYLGQAFGLALCKHYGLDPDMVCGEYRIVAKVDEPFTVEIKLLLTPEDLEGIGQKMREEQKP